MPGVGRVDVPLHRRGDALIGRYLLRGLPRGHYRLEHATLAVEDPFCLVQREVELPATGTIVVYPRIFDLGRLFPDGGGPHGAAGRLLLSRGAGFDLHSVSYTHLTLPTKRIV